MSRKTPKAGSVVLAFLILVSAVLCLSAEGHFRLHLFEFGIKHGVEDRHSGIAYASDAPGLKILRNSESWNQGDKCLVRRMVADPPPVFQREALIFMAGYNCGYYSSLLGLFVTLVIVVLVVFIRVRARPQPLAKG